MIAFLSHATTLTSWIDAKVQLFSGSALDSVAWEKKHEEKGDFIDSPV